jgi:hypothetical protein
MFLIFPEIHHLQRISRTMTGAEPLNGGAGASKRAKTYTQNRKNAINNNIALKQPKTAVNGEKSEQIACPGDGNTTKHQHFFGESEYTFQVNQTEIAKGKLNLTCYTGLDDGESLKLHSTTPNS